MSPARVAPSARRSFLRSFVAPALLTCSLLVALPLVATPAAADVTHGDTVVGELVQAWSETAASHEAPAAPISWIETAAGDSVRVPTEDVADLPVGATVEVRVLGQPDDGDPESRVLESEVIAPAPAPDPAPAPSGSLTNEVTVVLAAPAGTSRDSTQVADLQAMVDGAVAAFWAAQSDGAIRIGVTQTLDWIETSTGCSDAAALWNEAAAAAGFRSGPGRHLMVYVPPAAGCAYALAEIGTAPSSGGRLYVTEPGTSVIAHEFGHNFGLGHSAGQQCDGSVEDGTCRVQSYRDYYDVMGASWAQYGSLNVVHAARLGFLPAAAQQTLGRTGSTTTVMLAPVSDRTGTRALRLTDAEGVDYWLEYRAASGADSWLTDGVANRFGLDSGVLLRRADAFPNSSVLLDGTPSATADWETDMGAALPLGVAVPVSGGDYSVTVQGLAPTGAVLSISSTATATSATTPPGRSRPGRGDAGVLTADPIPAPAVEATPVAAPFWAPAPVRPRSVLNLPGLTEAAETSSLTVLLAPLAGIVLLGAATLAVLRLRRPVRR